MFCDVFFFFVVLMHSFVEANFSKTFHANSPSTDLKWACIYSWLFLDDILRFTNLKMISLVCPCVTILVIRDMGFMLQLLGIVIFNSEGYKNLICRTK